MFVSQEHFISEVFFIFYVLIKRVHVFYKWLLVLLPRGWGVPIYNWKNLKSGKIKSKKGLCTIQKVKTKNITNESLPVPCVIDQCSRVDRTCG